MAAKTDPHYCFHSAEYKIHADLKTVTCCAVFVAFSTWTQSI